MGYESKLYVIEKTRCSFDDDGYKYAQVIAMFDMCKFYGLSDRLTKSPKTNYYFYADDGNTRVLEDMYGDKLTETSLADVIEILEEQIDNGETYRRIYPALAALKELEEHKDQWHELAVLHYGY